MGDDRGSEVTMGLDTPGDSSGETLDSTSANSADRAVGRDDPGQDPTLPFPPGGPSSAEAEPTIAHQAVVQNQDAGAGATLPLAGSEATLPLAREGGPTMLDGPRPAPWEEATGGPPTEVATIALDAPTTGPDSPTVGGGDEGGRPTGGFEPFRIANYRIVGELGRGGMGVVYKAEHVLLVRTVALKVILAGSHAGSEQLARFHEEARAVAHLQHPGIVQIFDIGETEGLPYFSLEYVSGGALDRQIDGKPQAATWSARLMEQIADAMRAAHESGIIHRDLKPANILMTTDGDPKVTDFGLAKRLEVDSGQTRSGSIMGTPSYMAPEQAWGQTREIGPHSDIYSLGAILYTLLTGRPPHQGTSLLETLEMARTREPVPPSQLQPRVPRDLETICLKCLQKEPSRRYASAGALADDLRRFLDSSPILARPVSAPERVWRWCRRHPLEAGLISAVAALIVAVLTTLAVANARLGEKNDALDLAYKGEAAARKTAQEKEKLAEDKEREAREAQKLAEQKRQEAEESVAKALDQNGQAIDAWRNFGSVAYKDLARIPGTESVRLKLLGQVTGGLVKSLEGMEPLYKVARQVRNPRLADHAMAGVYKQVGDIMVEIGQVGDAVKPYSQMDRLYEALARANPDDDHYKMTLAMGKSTLGTFYFYSMARTEDAERNYRVALAIFRELLARKPDDGAARRRVANGLGMVAAVALKLDHREEATRLYGEEVRIRENLPEPERSDFEARRELSGLHERLGELAIKRRDVKQADTHFRRSSDIREELAREQPDHVPNLRDLVGSNENFGHFALLARNDPDGARVFYERAVAGRKVLAARDPDSATFKGDLASSYYYLATALLRLHKPEEALENYRRCRDIRRGLAGDPENRPAQNDLVLALARCGDHAEAAGIARKLIASAPADAKLYVEVACGLALCAGAAEADKDAARAYTDEAIGAIRQGVRRGWRDFGRLDDDPDLDPIRGDAAFKGLVAGLKAPEAAAQGR